MIRKSNDDLLLGLVNVLDHEHRARTGHDYTRGPFVSVCLCCSWLRRVMKELEERHYAALAQEQAESEVEDRP